MSLNPSLLRAEGDTNASPARAAFVADHLDARTRDLLAEDARYFVHQALSTPCLNVIESASGPFLHDLEGRRIFDFHGNSVHQVGHAHPRVVAAIRHQLEQLTFCPRRFTNRTAIELARRLSHAAPVPRGKEPPRVLLAPSGTVAVGIALKMVRAATGRYKTISMWDSFHGASLDAVSVGGLAQFRHGMGPLLPGCLHVPPYEPRGVGRQSADYIDYVLRSEGDIAAVIAEPMRWTTVVPPPREYWAQVREACDRHAALLVFDEIPACLGRTGQLFCCEHFDVAPDIVVLGKGLGGGVFPLAAIVVRGDLPLPLESSLGHYTHEKSPLGAAAAVATLEVIEEERLVNRARDLGHAALTRLTADTADMRAVREVRGLGLQLAIELTTKFDHDGAAPLADRVLYECLRTGLSFKVAEGNVLALSPPLNITDAELDNALEILLAALRRIADSVY